MNSMLKKWLCMTRYSVLLTIASFLAITSCGCSQKGDKAVPPSGGDFVRLADDIQVPTELLTIPVQVCIFLDWISDACIQIQDSSVF